MFSNTSDHPIFHFPKAFAAAGADVLFIDALESKEEMETFCNLGGAAGGKPKVQLRAPRRWC